MGGGGSATFRRAGVMSTYETKYHMPMKSPNTMKGGSTSDIFDLRLRLCRGVGPATVSAASTADCSRAVSVIVGAPPLLMRGPP